MPFSKTEICNMALGHIGVADRLTDVDTESGTTAESCRLYFDLCRGTVLEMQEWNFANRQVTLQDIGQVRTEWAYRYMYPNFCRLALFIVNPNDRRPGRDQKIPFKIVDLHDSSGKAILTDQPEAILEYNHDIQDTGLFPFTFVQALSLLLATHIATPIRVDPKITLGVEQRFAIWMNEAASLNFREAEPDPERVSEFQSVRG